jgi:dTDP-4-amino-4,6-dideoxygalactose transaminase
VKTAISKGSRAILPMHIYGQPADMYPINETARRYGRKVIKDAAHAHGVRYKGSA